MTDYAPVNARHWCLIGPTLSNAVRIFVEIEAYLPTMRVVTQNGRMPRQIDSKTRYDITRRDGSKCCVTGKKGTFWDPLLVLPILPIPSGWDTEKACSSQMDHPWQNTAANYFEKAQIFDMLGAFFGPQYRDWWLSYVRGTGFVVPYYSHWLVRQSAAKALALGKVRLDRLYPSVIEVRHGCEYDVDDFPSFSNAVKNSTRPSMYLSSRMQRSQFLLMAIIRY